MIASMTFFTYFYEINGIGIVCHVFQYSKLNAVWMTFVVSLQCLSQFDMAFNHNVLTLRKNRIIVMTMFDNQSAAALQDRATDCLRQYMRMYACVEYGKDNWLDRVLYALPLKGMMQPIQHSQSDYVDPVTISLEDSSSLQQPLTNT
jgi:hypothetical protein